jgi:hypothetical protein
MIRRGAFGGARRAGSKTDEAWVDGSHMPETVIGMRGSCVGSDGQSGRMVMKATWEGQAAKKGQAAGAAPRAAAHLAQRAQLGAAARRGVQRHEVVHGAVGGLRGGQDGGDAHLEGGRVGGGSVPIHCAFPSQRSRELSNSSTAVRGVRAGAGAGRGRGGVGTRLQRLACKPTRTPAAIHTHTLIHTHQRHERVHRGVVRGAELQADELPAGRAAARRRRGFLWPGARDVGRCTWRQGAEAASLALAAGWLVGGHRAQTPAAGASANPRQARCASGRVSACASRLLARAAAQWGAPPCRAAGSRGHAPHPAVAHRQRERLLCLHGGVKAHAAGLRIRIARLRRRARRRRQAQGRQGTRDRFVRGR